jgi:tetratricopeptide (TPR) repeat protein
MTLNNLGNVALAQGDEGYAKRLWEESLELRRPFGDKQGTSGTLINLGELALGAGDVERAVVLTEEGLAIASEVGYTPHVAAAHSNLGLAALQRGDTNSATSHFEECLPLCRESGDAQLAAVCLAGLAGVAVERGERDRAARLWAAAQAVHEVEGTAPAPMLDFVVRRVSDALSEVGERLSAELRDEGRAMTLNDAIGYAMANLRGARSAASARVGRERG